MHILRKSLSALLFVGLLTGCGGSEEEESTADIAAFLANAEGFRDSGQFQSSVIESRNAIQAAPEDPRGHISLAESLLLIGQGRQAISVLEPLNADSALYRVVLADAYLRAGKFRSAREILASGDVSGEQPRADLLNARLALQQGDTDLAMSGFRSLVDDGQFVAEARIGIAGIAAADEDWAGAQKELDAVLAEDPTNAEALLFLSGLKARQGNLVGAEEDLMSAVSVLPASDIMTPLRFAVLSALRDNLTDQGKSNEALIYSGLIAESTPGAQEINDKLEAATQAISGSDFETARQLLAEVQEVAPNSERAATMLGLIAYLEGDNSGALEQFERFVDPETASPMTLQIMALAEFRLNQPERVVETLRKDIDDSTDGRLVAMYGIALLSSGELEEGESYLRKSIDLEPDNGRLRLPLARLLNVQGDNEAALAQAQLAFTATAEDPTVQAAYVQQLVSMERLKEADDVIQGLQSGYPDSQDTQLIVAGYHMSQEAFVPARAALNRVLEIGDSRPAKYQLARIAFTEEKYDEALGRFEELIDEDPEDTQAYKALFTIFEVKEEGEKALAILQEYVAKGETVAPVLVLAEYHGRNGDYDTAFELLEDYEPDAHPTLAGLRLTLFLSSSSGHMQQREYDEARAVLVDGLSEFAEETRLLASLVTVELASDNLPEARKVYTRLAEIIPDAPIVAVLAGDIANRERDYRKAKIHYLDAWEKGPTDQIAVKAYSMLRQVHDLVDEQHLDFLNSWKERLPNSLLGPVTLAGHYMEVGRPDDARTEYEGIVEVNPNVAIAHNNLAWLYSEDEVSLAVEAGRKAYELAPQSAEIIDTYGWFLYKDGDLDQAYEMLAKAVELAPENEEIKAHYEEVKQAR